MDERDAKFLRDMIAHHEAALEMARDYLRTTPASVRLARVADLARGVITAQTAEIATMRKWLSDAGQSAPAKGRGGMSM